MDEKAFFQKLRTAFSKFSALDAEEKQKAIAAYRQQARTATGGRERRLYTTLANQLEKATSEKSQTSKEVTLAIRMKRNDKEVLSFIAELHGLTVSALIHQAVTKKIYDFFHEVN